jgi:hypothetical protein
MRDKHRSYSNAVAVKAREIIVFTNILNVLCVERKEITIEWTWI